MWNSTAFSEKRSESRSTRSMQKYQYFEWGSTLNLDGFKIITFQYIICEPFRSWKEGLVKLDVNLWEIWWKFKCRRSASGPPLVHVASLHEIKSVGVSTHSFRGLPPKPCFNSKIAMVWMESIMNICDVIKQNESKLANTVFKIQPKSQVSFVSYCLFNPSTVSIFGTNCPISVGFSPN